MVLAHWFLPHMVPAALAPDAGFQQAAARKASGGDNEPADARPRPRVPPYRRHGVGDAAVSRPALKDGVPSTAGTPERAQYRLRALPARLASTAPPT